MGRRTSWSESPRQTEKDDPLSREEVGGRPVDPVEGVLRAGGVAGPALKRHRREGGAGLDGGLVGSVG